MNIIDIISAASRPPFGAPNNRTNGPRVHRGVWGRGVGWTVWAACHVDTRIIRSEHAVEAGVTCDHCRRRRADWYPLVAVSDLDARLECWAYVVQAVDPFAKAARALSTLMPDETRQELVTIYADLRCYTGQRT